MTRLTGLGIGFLTIGLHLFGQMDDLQAAYTLALACWLMLIHATDPRRDPK